ncbi:MAG: glycosyltransferase, partial [Deltaproteobacteria bacterium]
MQRPSRGAYFRPTSMSEAASPFPRLAYLVSEYPKASHSFIRREILEIERLSGRPVLRVAIRGGGKSVVDPADVREAAKTIEVLDRSPAELAAATAEIAALHPIRYRRAVEMSGRMWAKSDRGAIRHGAYLAEAAFIARLLMRERIDHLHVHFGLNSAAVARLVKCLTNIPYSVSIHGPGEFDEPLAISLREKMEDASFVRAVSHYGSGQLRRWVGPDHWDKIQVVRCTVDDSFFDAAVPVPATSKSIVCVGRLTAPKGHLLLLDAFARIIDDGLDAKLVLAGDGELRPEVEKKIAEHDLGKYVEVTGWVGEAEVRRRLLAARAMVLPSLAEGLPVVIMESLALGRPVITTMIAGIPELMKNDAGWLIPSGSVDHIADALKEALTSPSTTLDTMAQAGRERVEAGHRTAEIAKLFHLFEDYHRYGGPLRSAHRDR